MPQHPGDFMQQWIADHVDLAGGAGQVDALAVRCIADAKAAGISAADVVDEVGTDIRTLISDAIERQWD